MATVIDALTVTLGLDPSGYNKGQKEADDQLKKSKDAAVKGSKEWSEANKKTAESFSGIKKEALGLFSVLIGAGTLAAFTKNTVTSMVAVSQAARAMGAATKDVAAFGATIKANGGDYDAAVQSLSTLTQVMERFRTLGQIDPNTLGALQVIGANNPNLSALQVFQKYANWATGKDARRVQMEGNMLGFDQGSINEAMGGGKQFSSDFNDAMARVINNQESYDKVKNLQKAFIELGQSIQKAGSNIIVDLAPATTTFLTDWGNAVNHTLLGVHALINAFKDVKSGNFAAAGTESGNFFNEEVKAYGSYFPHGSKPGASAPSHPASTPANMDQANRIALYLKSNGVSDAAIIGVLRGIRAEGGKFGEVDQVDVHGNAAHGIGQWRGPRWAALVAKYGNHPTPEQEMAFLLSELKGGDKGGASVLGSTSADAATRAYLQNFMRPGSGLSGDLARAGLYGGSITGASGGGTTNIHVARIEINTKSSDAKGIAREVKAVLNTRALTGMANQGLV